MKIILENFIKKGTRSGIRKKIIPDPGREKHRIRNTGRNGC
jgi:hypothetical protein